jgi:hypothetical protein
MQRRRDHVSRGMDKQRVTVRVRSADERATERPARPGAVFQMTAWPSRDESWSETRRARTSTTLPASTGTMTRSGFAGQAWGCAAVPSASERRLQQDGSDQVSCCLLCLRSSCAKS